MTNIQLHNTKTRRKEAFVPIDDKNVQMYVCGPTVYDRAHLGNARAVVVFDTLFRLLRHEYGDEHVTYVRNFTDVDDKINATALARKDAGADGSLEDLITERSDETIAWYLADMGSLGALEPTHAPRATEYIAPMVTMIKDLIAKGHAYAKDGHALFRVRSYKDYGKLSGRSVDDMIAGARVEIAPFKEDPMDFVLWKPSTDDQPGWDSPWGRGRPGWHIECSAMAHDLLGETFDIHGGGNDLMFPHHENEIAQSACAGHGFANVWMHNEMLQVEGKKMSKSLGNFFTVRELLEGHGPSDKGVPGEVIRFVMLSTHYRKPMDWTVEKAVSAASILFRFVSILDGFGQDPIDFEAAKKEVVDPEILNALKNDLNTHEAIERLKTISKELTPTMLARGIEFLGLMSWEQMQRKVVELGETKEQLAELAIHLEGVRKAAKESKDFSKLDSWKSHLDDAGYSVQMASDHVHITPQMDFSLEKLKSVTKALK
ncbi:MAG: cysteinyl-tRNA synthetase [Ascidiaceihabitans sp.]|jgi:cysteinyl-tRNA synthetase